MKIKGKLVTSICSLLIILGVAISFLTYSSMESLMFGKVSEELVNYSKMGMQVLDNKIPGEWNLADGILCKGECVINDSEIVTTEINKMTQDSNLIQTIFMEDTRVVTNVVDAQGVPQVGTQASDTVIQHVLVEGNVYEGTADIMGIEALTRYEPIYDATGEIVGMWFMGVYIDAINTEINGIMNSLIGTIILFLINALIVGYIIGHMIAKKIRKAQEKIEAMENGGFDFSYSEKELKGKDEVAIITRSTNHMKENIASIVSNIQLDATEISQHSENSLANVAQINNAIDNISAATEELSASMEETTAFAQEMNSAIVEIGHEITNVKAKTEDVGQLSVEIKGRAEQLHTQANESKTLANDIYTQTNMQLRSSIEKAQAIEKIKELTDTIMKITAKTNLLAINASIEAARAGEAGKGFSVVADQICVLADSSKAAVSSISEITNYVSEAVNSVLEDSRKLLDFVDEQVMSDYEVLADAGIQYNEDADAVYDSISEIAESIQKLHATIHEITSGVEQVSIAALHGAEGTMEVAEKIGHIATQAKEVETQNTENQDNIKALREAIGFFKI